MPKRLEREIGKECVIVMEKERLDGVGLESWMNSLPREVQRHRQLTEWNPGSMKRQCKRQLVLVPAVPLVQCRREKVTVTGNRGSELEPCIPQGFDIPARNEKNTRVWIGDRRLARTNRDVATGRKLETEVAEHASPLFERKRGAVSLSPAERCPRQVLGKVARDHDIRVERNEPVVGFRLLVEPQHVGLGNLRVHGLDDPHIDVEIGEKGRRLAAD